MDNKDHTLIQDVINYSESRFKKVFLAMEKRQKGPDKHPKWMDYSLNKELVSLG